MSPSFIIAWTKTTPYGIRNKTKMTSRRNLTNILYDSKDILSLKAVNQYQPIVNMRSMERYSMKTIDVPQKRFPLFQTTSSSISCSLWMGYEIIFSILPSEYTS